MKEYWRFVARLLSILWSVVFVLSGITHVAYGKAHYVWEFPTDARGFTDWTVIAWLFWTLFIWLVAEAIAWGVSRRRATAKPQPPEELGPEA